MEGTASGDDNDDLDPSPVRAYITSCPYRHLAHTHAATPFAAASGLHTERHKEPRLLHRCHLTPLHRPAGGVLVQGSHREDHLLQVPLKRRLLCHREGTAHTMDHAHPVYACSTPLKGLGGEGARGDSAGCWRAATIHRAQVSALLLR